MPAFLALLLAAVPRAAAASGAATLCQEAEAARAALEKTTLELRELRRAEKSRLGLRKLSDRRAPASLRLPSQLHEMSTLMGRLKRPLQSMMEWGETGGCDAEAMARAWDLGEKAIGEAKQAASKEQEEFDDFRKEVRSRARLRRMAWTLGPLAFGALLGWAWASRRAAPAPPARLAAPEPGTLGGKYRVLGELGRGGMGVVLEAEDLLLKRIVAVKRMREEVGMTPEGLEAFRREARLVAALDHPNVVKIYEEFVDQGAVHLVFERLEGRSLDKALLEAGRFPARKARGVLLLAGAALDHAHAHKVIHRDLKPSNIMLTDGGSVKVMDFGIAHQAKVTVGRLTRADPWGTPHYMPPEQELGAVSRESDVYALAVCLYEMLAGARPFSGPDFLGQKRRMEWAPLRGRFPDVPDGVDAVLRRALEPDPARRFGTAAALVEAFDAALGGAGVRDS